MLSPQFASQSTAPLCHAIVEEAATAEPATHPLLDMRSNLRDVDARGPKGAPAFEVRMGYRYDDPRIDRRP